MNLTLPLLAILVLVGLTYDKLADNTTISNKKIINFSHKKIQLSYTQNNMIMAKNELKKDSDWLDCTGADRLCNSYDTTYFPIYSTIIENPMEDIIEGKNSNTVNFQPLDATTGILMSKTKSPSGTTIFAELVQQGFVSARNQVPNVHAKNFTTTDNIHLCSYSYDLTYSTFEGLTDPTVTQYVNANQSDLYNKSFITNPNSKTYSELYTELNPLEYSVYQDYEMIFSIKDINMYDNTYVETAYTNGILTQTGSAQAINITENGSMTYPDFRPIRNIDSMQFSSIDINCTKDDIVYLQQGAYNNIKLESGCEIYFLGKEYSIRSITTENKFNNKAILAQYQEGDTIINLGTLNVVKNTKLNMIQQSSNKFTTYNVENLLIGENAEFNTGNLLQSKMNIENVIINQSSKTIANILAKEITFNKVGMLPVIGDTYMIGVFYANTIDINFSGLNFCNTVDTSTNPNTQISSIEWIDLTNSTSGSGVDVVSVVDTVEKIFCKDSQDCIIKLTDVYNNL